MNETRELVTTGEAELQQSRNINQVTIEIKTLHHQAQGLILGYAVEIGRRLAEAKELLPYGEWGKWLETEVEFSQDTAGRLMKLYDEYGSAQEGIFGAEVDSAALRNLSYTKALRLLALPKEEREQFVHENDVEELSTRELDKIIKEKQEEAKRADEAEKHAEELETRLAETNAKVKELESRPIDVAVQQPDEGAVNKLVEEALADAKVDFEKTEKTLRTKLEAAEKKRDAAEQKAKEAEEAVGNSEQKIADAVETAEKECETLERALAETKKQLAMADTGITAFKTTFETCVEMLNKLLVQLETIQNAETKDKLRAGAVKMLGSFGERLGENTWNGE